MRRQTNLHMMFRFIAAAANSGLVTSWHHVLVHKSEIISFVKKPLADLLCRFPLNTFKKNYIKITLIFNFAVGSKHSGNL
jgi:hypothetical protein